jgi:hypothetical protein
MHVWDGLFTRFATQVAFFSSRVAHERFKSLFPAMRCYWIPDGSSPELHKPDKLLTSRSIDVVELGRKYERYHHAITPQLTGGGMKHVYASRPGQVVFPGRQALVDGLAESKIVVCFPASVTHPDHGIESITPRYFEAMASGCLIVGHCPLDLHDLFGYNPVVEAELDNPAQIKNILSRIEDYQPLVRKNLARVTERETWLHRARSVKEILETENGLF